MTGFGRASLLHDEQPFRLELRAVNSRFLDIKIRLPWVDTQVEHQVSGLLRERLARGRVELMVVGDVATGESSLRVNRAAAEQLALATRELASLLDGSLVAAAQLVPPIKELLVASAVHNGSEELWAQLEPAVERALQGLVEMRDREGEALARDLRQQLTDLERVRAEIESETNQEPRRRADRLSERLAQLMGANDTVESTRLAQEVALLADRCDINEELTRLAAHLEQLSAMFDDQKPIGRKIEFMVQELNRELNTISSKSASAKTAMLVVEAKGFVEKMREQAQNVE